MKIETIADARALVGRSFDRDGKRIKVEAMLFNARLQLSEAGATFTANVEEFADWLSLATEATP